MRVKLIENAVEVVALNFWSEIRYIWSGSILEANIIDKSNLTRTSSSRHRICDLTNTENHGM